jgi:hypothetical protein
MQNENQFSPERTVAVIRKDCERQAERAAAKLTEVIECLHDENHLGALGAFAGLDEDTTCLKVFLVRIARLTVGDADLASIPQRNVKNKTRGKKRSKGGKSQ